MTLNWRTLHFVVPAAGLGTGRIDEAVLRGEDERDKRHWQHDLELAEGRPFATQT
jgi:hypothetical protein